MDILTKLIVSDDVQSHEKKGKREREEVRLGCYLDSYYDYGSYV